MIRSLRMPIFAFALAVLLVACGNGSVSVLPTGSSGGTSTGAGASSSSSSSSGGSSSSGATATADVLTYHYDTMRTGQNLNETTLTPTNVNSSGFGLLRILAADGLVDAAPLIVTNLTVNGSAHNVVYVESEHDTVYAYDTDTGALLKQVSLLGSGETPSDSRGCGQVQPDIGITSTPVIDRSAGPNGTMFVVAMSKNGSGTYYQRLHALDLVSLADRMTPVSIEATVPGTAYGASGQVAFVTDQYKERGALLLQQGQIFTVWASHCDDGAYNGWVIAYNETTLTQTQVLNLTPNGSQGAIWDVSGVAADGDGAMYTLLGNGIFDTTLDTNNLPLHQDYGNTAVKMSLGTSGALAVSDYFAPSNTTVESQGDIDLGSGSPLLLPDQVDSSGVTRHLMLAMGKDTNLYLLNRDNMGKFNSGSNQIFQEVSNSLSGGVFSAPVYFAGSIYFADVGGTLKQYALSAARLPTSATSQSTVTFAFPGASPSISANGGSSAIVWAVQSNTSSAAVLHAYNPANLAVEYYNSTQAGSRDGFGSGNKFVTPVVSAGKVFVGTPSGVAEFGLL
ncbi:MAG TPA: hypothetical protein VGF89_10875 [Steroidobacteraceae bacterium]|jgi:hypothetical protein